MYLRPTAQNKTKPWTQLTSNATDHGGKHYKTTKSSQIKINIRAVCNVIALVSDMEEI